jgi:hypothetical protein
MLLIVLPWSRALVRVSPASKTPMLGAILWGSARRQSSWRTYYGSYAVNESN